jgi:CheY-like chemotaxis protein
VYAIVSVQGALIMAIYRLLRNSPLGPEEISRLTAAYEQTLRALNLKDRSDPITQLVAKRIIEIYQTGVRDPVELSTIAVEQLLTKYRALVIEDEYFLAEDLKAALNSFGMEVMTCIGDLNAALDQLAHGGFDVAVLDINLHGRDAFSIADELKRKWIPFVFATGYGPEMIPDRFADVIRWEKPFDALNVARDVARLCQRAVEWR